MRLKSLGFTLIELLIVIAIISVLAGILFAAFGPAREKARQSVCISNLHQNGLAIAMYRADYDGQEAEVGVPLTQAQLGLPSSDESVSVDAFFKGYLKTMSLTTCPSFHGPHNFTGFQYIFFHDNDEVFETSKLVARDGD